MAKKSDGKTSAATPAAKKGSAVGVGVGLGAAVAAAGAYFLYGSKSAAKNRKQVKSWALKAKAEVLEKLEDAKEMSEKEYQDLIKSVTGAYKGAKNANQKDLVDFSKEMKDHWKAIEKAAAPLKKSGKTVAKAVKKEAKTAVKETKQTAKSVIKKTTKAVKKSASKSK